MHKLVARILVLVMFIFMLAGCSGNKNKETNQSSGQPGAAEQAPVNQQEAQQSPGTGADAQAANQQTAVQQQSSPTGQAGATVPVPAPEQPQAAPKASGNDAGKASAPAVSRNYSLSVGGYFPPFNLAGLDGIQYSSASVFGANKVTLINCWATFCGPCIREMPDLEKLRQNYQGQGLGVIGIVLDAKKAEQARTMAARLGTGYPHLLDDGRYGQYIYAVPQTYLVDSEGKIVQAVTGASNLQYFSGLVEPYLK